MKLRELTKRRNQSAERFKQLKSSLSTAARLVEGKACVYATGSFGRGEASEHSDLDLFIVGKNGAATNKYGFKTSLLSNLEAICVKADLIEASEKLKFPPFSGDGRYLTEYSLDELTNTLGRPEDDSTNTLTARLLLLLESWPIAGETAYREIVNAVVSAYWRDFQGHDREFMPAFIINDILRLWRTFCVNYEARVADYGTQQKEKAKLANYKLKNSRMMTCFSAVASLLAAYVAGGTVTIGEAVGIVGRTPTERLEDLIAGASGAAVSDPLERALASYDKFLEMTDRPEQAQLEMLSSKAATDDLFRTAKVVGDSLSEAITALGGESPLFRRLLDIASCGLIYPHPHDPCDPSRFAVPERQTRKKP